MRNKYDTSYKTNSNNFTDSHSAFPNDAMPDQSPKDIQVDEMTNEQTRNWIPELDVEHLMLSILEDKMHDEASVISGAELILIYNGQSKILRNLFTTL